MVEHLKFKGCNNGTFMGTWDQLCLGPYESPAKIAKKSANESIQYYACEFNLVSGLAVIDHVV